MRPSIHPTLEGISHGDHCCLLFNSPELQTDATASFLAVGLERDERSIYVGNTASIECIRESLKGRGVNVETETWKKRLVLSSDRDYLDGGQFSPDKMLSFLQQTYDSTLAEGFTALRATGDISWEIGPEQNYKDIVYYETLLDVFFLGKKMVGMCQYPKDKCPPEILAGILSTHKVATVDGEICSNFHYLPPELLVEKDAAVRHQKRVEWMTSQLLRARRAEDEILRLNATLEQKVAERTAELHAAFKEMESFSYSVSHDLRAPLRAIDGYSAALVEDVGPQLGERERDHLERIRQNAQRMDQIIRDLLKVSKVSTPELAFAEVDMTALARSAAREAGAAKALISGLPPAYGDASLLRQVLANLLSNAVKFTRTQAEPKIEVTGHTQAGQTVYQVRDNGVGFDGSRSGRLFGAFQRFHSQSEFEGTGIGLATAHRVIMRHGGRIWAESSIGQGATFFFALPSHKEE